MVASEQFRPSPLVAVFDFGYEEVERQVKSRGTINNKVALERTLQLGVSEELAKLERNMNWLATTASVSAVHRAVRHGARHHPGVSAARGKPGSASLRAVGPGISEALIATAVGLARPFPRPSSTTFRPCHPGDRRAHGRLRARVHEHGRTKLRRVSDGILSQRWRRAAAGGRFHGTRRCRKSTSRRSWTSCWCC